MNNLSVASQRIGAVDLGNGFWAHYDDGTQSWWKISESDLVSLGNRLLAGEDVDYSRWCGDTLALEMPKEWIP